VTLARGFALPLFANPANNSLKQLLQSAEVTQKHNRVVVSARLSPSLLTTLEQNENSLASPATLPDAPASR
jgi:hypothetical protein